MRGQSSGSLKVPCLLQDVTRQGYGKILSQLGRNFVDFLCQLNNLHLHLSMSSPSMVPPDFRVNNVTPSSLELHYRSKRPGLESWVVGICEEVAESIYGITVDFKLLRGRADGTCDHEVSPASRHARKGNTT